MSEPNYAANIIVTLASLPEFLRKPMLSARVSEFPRLPKNEQVDVIHHALDASPTIPFDKFSTLLQTWLEVVSEQEAEDRRVLLEAYASEILSNPDKLVQLHMDGIVDVFLGLEPNRQNTIITTLRMILSDMDDNDKSKLIALTPESIKQILDI
ncbi:MAG: hypothetical protein F4Y18_00270 [Cenarchaeum sp. SB0663_bin_5]|nr:hypothetical protein [Cenarchaeum sp. SB0663_bin_5]MYH04291.1 hypothetical protein [Cenarchaeum sp. SB0675_bin_21]MYL11956.1 hypothetical protein [Cenarchaeum sp. SB0669_bin_11]